MALFDAGDLPEIAPDVVATLATVSCPSTSGDSHRASDP